MAAPAPRNRLFPWFVGITVIVIMDVVTAYLFFSTGCRAPGIAQALIRVAMPIAYFLLMYMAFKSQP